MFLWVGPRPGGTFMDWGFLVQRVGCKAKGGR